MNVLTLYPNCSLGGMTSVYLNRCLEKLDSEFHFIFMHDKGGKAAFTSLANTQVRVVRKDRFDSYLEHVVSNIEYDEIRITSLPALPKLLKENCKTKVIYEFHTSSLDIIKNELGQLSTDSVDEIWVPSNYLKDMIESVLDSDNTIKVVRNLANTNIFNIESEPTSKYDFPDGEVPIFWVGRFDKGKNYKDFFRALSLLESKFVGYVILSMENSSERYAEALGDLAFYGLEKRVRFFLNLTQQEVADFYKSASSINGMFCSTSLAESFGYGVLEAAMSGLPVVAYDVGALSEHLDYGYDMNLVNVGDTIQMACKIKSIKNST